MNCALAPPRHLGDANQAATKRVNLKRFTLLLPMGPSGRFELLATTFCEAIRSTAGYYKLLRSH